nr:hypothetical protein [uncultured Methanoregula sp.]
MTRGIKPLVAIGKAKRKATAWGFMLIGLETDEKLPCDFAFHHKGKNTLARVRRLKYADFRPEQILRTSARQIQELREAAIMANLAKELWVRGPDRTWHRYRILPETIDPVENPQLINALTGAQKKFYRNHPKETRVETVAFFGAPLPEHLPVR